MKPLRSVEDPSVQVPTVTGNGVVLTPAQYSWGRGAERRVSSPDPSAVPIAKAPTEGDTITFRLATDVRPSIILVSAYSRLEPGGTPDPSSERALDCGKSGVCDVSEDGATVTIRIVAAEAQIVTLRTAFDAPDIASPTGLGEPYTASWVVRLTS